MKEKFLFIKRLLLSNIIINVIILILMLLFFINLKINNILSFVPVLYFLIVSLLFYMKDLGRLKNYVVSNKIPKRKNLQDVAFILSLLFCSASLLPVVIFYIFNWQQLAQVSFFKCKDFLFMAILSANGLILATSINKMTYIVKEKYI